VALLLLLVAWGVGLLRSFVDAASVRRWIRGKPRWVAQLGAALAGVATPFCSCSAVPLFMGFVQSGVPLGAALSFLIASPMVNEVALGLLFTLFGWKAGLAYFGTGLAVALAGGALLGRFDWTGQVEDLAVEPEGEPLHWTWPERFGFAWGTSLAVLKKVWPWILAGVGAGSFFHAWIPDGSLAPWLQGSGAWSVPLAVAIGVPLYSNAAGVVPLLSALLEKGVPLGTALAFLMATIGLSLPEAVLLRRVMKPRLLAAYFLVVALGIVLAGWILNALLA
jgi:hypothetical protein